MVKRLAWIEGPAIVDVTVAHIVEVGVVGPRAVAGERLPPRILEEKAWQETRPVSAVAWQSAADNALARIVADRLCHNGHDSVHVPAAR